MALLGQQRVTAEVELISTVRGFTTSQLPSNGDSLTAALVGLL